MKRLQCIVAVMIAFAAIASAAVNPVGHIVALKGSASAVGSDGLARNLASKSEVFPMDKIETGAKSRLQIMLSDDSLISMGEKGELLLEKYIYDKKSKSNSVCDLAMKKGVFRVITDKISRINPDKFRVKTRMATIGIRGCDVGFLILPAEEHFYVLTLHGREEVVLGGFVPVADGGPAMPPGGLAGGVLSGRSRTMLVLKAGQPIGGFGELPSDLLRAFLDAVDVSGGTFSRRGVPGVGFIPLEWFIATASGTPQPTLPATPGVTDPDGPEQDDPDDPDGTGAGAADPAVEQEETPSTPIYTAMGSGTDWNWGYWSLDEHVTAVAFKGRHLIVDNAFRELRDGSMEYILTGSGDAAATLKFRGVVSLVTGNCGLNVRVGDGALPMWSGIFSMGNDDGDALDFEAGGGILSGGRMVGTTDNYSMTVQDTPFSARSITREDIEGYLLGPGLPSEPPVTGVFGRFSVDHGQDARVRGGFASELAPLGGSEIAINGGETALP